MTVTLDKFGRIVIPKKLRDSLGLKPGAELELTVSESECSLHVSPLSSPPFEIKTTDWGWPVIHYLDEEPRSFDPTSLITAGREERMRKLTD